MPKRVAAAVAVLLLSACATQTPPAAKLEAPQSTEAQRAAQRAVTQAAPSRPVLKRKVAIGRVSNETPYGGSLLLRDSAGDPLGKQVSDMMAKALVESGNFIVLERPDIGRLKDEAALTGQQLSLVGADALVMGSLTEFGRKVVGETGFLSQSKKQVAFAKLDVRLVEASTARVFFSTSGAGEASTETASVAGFGSQASYDGTLGDAALRQAVSEVVNRLTTQLMARPWTTYFLTLESDRAFISGGKAQGIAPGMVFSVQTVGQKVKSPQTGFDVTLPGKTVAEVKVVSTFGDNETNEGSVVTVVAGSLSGQVAQNLVVLAKE
jgi:curli biogenesis system outer membrane secretion channel CsgG